MHYAPRREDTRGDDEPVRARNPEEPDAQLVGTGRVMRVQEDRLWDGVPQLDVRSDADDFW